MKFEKRGLVFSPNNQIWWQQFYAILPTPIYIQEQGVIRIFFASTCDQRYGRIASVDLCADTPSNILSYSNNYILDVGQDGAFDDCGVNPASIISVDNQYYLYYAGYQRHIKTPYSILSGLAISDDLKTFKRIQNNPILERTSEEISLRSAPTVINLEGSFFMVYVADYGWENIAGGVFNNRKMPRYCLKTATSNDGISWISSLEPIVFPCCEDEFGFGRPYLIKQGEIYYLFYSIRRKSITYRIGYAISKDNCTTWQRIDDIQGLNVSLSGWDSEMICYGAPITVGNKTFMFYNGNNNGESGFGYAELIEW
jgi:predicted GH43/DUF377 family glycosyl hydrolase